VSDKSARILVRVQLVDDLRAEFGKDVRFGVGVRVGVAKCQLKHTGANLTVSCFEVNRCRT